MGEFNQNKCKFKIIPNTKQPNFFTLNKFNCIHHTKSEFKNFFYARKFWSLISAIEIQIKVRLKISFLRLKIHHKNLNKLLMESEYLKYFNIRNIITKLIHTLHHAAMWMYFPRLLFLRSFLPEFILPKYGHLFSIYS